MSKPGEYKGYSQAHYHGYALSSQYVKVRDDTELAVDLYRPKDADGKVVEAPLPVLWMHTPYNRRYFSSGGSEPGLTGETYPGAAVRLVEFGYVVAVVDFRGLYASFGQNAAYNRGEWIDAAHWDAYDITEWLAEQPWSSGKIGMWGCSATGGSQLQAAATAPPHLRAIFPMSCEFDVYSFARPGGIAPSPASGTGTSGERDVNAEPVDGDDDKSKLMQAIAEHSTNIESVGDAPYRDSKAQNVPEQWWLKSSPHSYLDAINASGIAIYLAANWDEGTTKGGAFVTYNNVKTPVKLIVGPAGHCAWVTVQQQTHFDITVEELRFFDHYLKDIDNGIADEPGVYFYTYNAPEESLWRSSPQWPLANEKRTNVYLSGNKTMTIVPPSGEATKDEKLVEYETTADNLLEKSLYYETPDYSYDVQITGHPTVDLWVSSTATDGDFIATLQDVAPDGTAISYNTNGRLRASLRNLADAPYNSLGLPWHPSNASDVTPLVPDEPTEIKFELLPISMIVRKGHHLRLVLSFSAGAATPQVSPAPTVTIYRDAKHRSAISLPIIPSSDN